ncbi:MAG: DinB family protein [Gemmatimonadales bacterium]
MTITVATWETAQLLLAELEQEAQATRRVLQRVPEDKLSWKPHPRSSSLGQLALHVAVIPSLGMHVLSTGKLVLLNYADDAAMVRLAGGKVVRVEPYSIVME